MTWEPFADELTGRGFHFFLYTHSAFAWDLVRDDATRSGKLTVSVEDVEGIHHHLFCGDALYQFAGPESKVLSKRCWFGLSTLSVVASR